jgi:hypothetical protein
MNDAQKATIDAARLRKRILNELDAWHQFWRNSDNRGAFPERSYVAEHVMGRPGAEHVKVNGVWFPSFSMHPVLTAAGVPGNALSYEVA